MTTQVDLPQVPRRDIRYVLICLQNKTDIGSINHRHIVDDVMLFVSNNGVSVDGFMKEWDIGIDTVDTMHMRPESWWLWGIAHTTVVKRPACSADIVGGIHMIHLAGFGRKGAKVPFTRADYQKLLEGAATRKGWV